jgi:hypothetical protein
MATRYRILSVPAGSTADLASIWKLVSAHEHRYIKDDYFRKQSLTAHIVNYDFFVHVLMMIYAEKVQKQVVQKNRELSESRIQD